MTGGFADGAVEVIEALGLPRVDLLGWTLGGTVALHATLRRPRPDPQAGRGGRQSGRPGARPAQAAYTAVQHLGNATLVGYSDAGHGFLFQRAKGFTGQVTSFLDAYNRELAPSATDRSGSPPMGRIGRKSAGSTMWRGAVTPV